MNKKELIFILFFVVIGVAAIFIYNYNSKNFKWHKTFETSSKEPYDFGVLNQLIEERFKDKIKIINDEKDYVFNEKEEGSTYFFLGFYPHFTEQEHKDLIDFVNNGNHLILFSEQIPDQFLNDFRAFSFPININSFSKNEVSVHYNFNGFNFKYRFYEKDTNYQIKWNYIDTSEFKYFNLFNNYKIKSDIDYQPNSILLNIGKGTVLINTTPILLTNYALKNKENFNYLNHLFADIKTNQFYYDILSKEYKPESSEKVVQNQSAISFILKQPALRWAWYILLSGVILFVFFGIKRQQRIIPVLKLKSNNSVDFIKSIGALYFSKGNHLKMAETKMQLFHYFLKNKLKIPLNEIDAKTKELISTKSKVPLNAVNQIFDFFESNINRRSKIDEFTLLKFNQLIESFYKHYKNQS